jgi:dimethylhistidine N-methyltransferase
MHSRLRFQVVDSGRHSAGLAEATAEGLEKKPKNIPCRFFYDDTGSEIFEEITRLPEYYLCRCETEILKTHASAIAKQTGDRISVAEFGSGSSCKTRMLIEAALARQERLHYIPIDISRNFLQSSALTLIERYPQLDVTALAGEYSESIAHLPSCDDPTLYLFLGSNIGNFTSCEAKGFLHLISKAMKPNDRLLIGADMVKDRDVLHRAYNDPAGVTARFNLNLLKRINHELEADFDITAFTHKAPFDEEYARIEMRLVSTIDQRVTIDGLGREIALEDGEYIVTEWSHKYTTNSFSCLAEDAGLEVVGQWQDSRRWFSEFLLRKG